jgi:hypothetical protein
VLPLTPYVDYEAWETADKTGQDYTAYTDALHPLGVLAFSVAATASEAQVSVVNTALGPIYLTDLAIRGTLITSYDTVQVDVEDADSQVLYGLRSLSITLPLPSSQPFAESLANYLLSRYKAPAYRLKWLQTTGQSLGGVSLWGIDIGDVLSVSEAQVGFSNTLYVVIGLRYQFSPPANIQIKLTVSRLDERTWGVFDDTDLGKFDTTLRMGI